MLVSRARHRRFVAAVLGLALASCIDEQKLGSDATSDGASETSDTRSDATQAFDVVEDVPPPPLSGQGALQHDQGINFATGLVITPGTYSSTDLYASTNGPEGLKLTTGGATIIENRPVTWWSEGWTSLECIPVDPAPDKYEPMLHAKSGTAFLLQTEQGDHVRGLIESASSQVVALSWERVGPATVVVNCD